MTQSQPQYRPPGADVFGTLISAALFLYVGFLSGLVGISDSELYNHSVTAFIWGARIVGIGLIIVAVLVHLRLPSADYLDLGLAVLATLLCLIVGFIWLAFDIRQGNAYLLLAFGALNANAVRMAWLRIAHRPAGAPPSTEDHP